MRPSSRLQGRRTPISHPIFGPTFARPTRLAPRPSDSKEPIPLSLLNSDQINLPPPPPRRLSRFKALTSTRLIQKIVSQSTKFLQIHPDRSAAIFASASSPWPANLRVVDEWSGRGKWGEGRPDHKEWLGVDKKHKDLMRSLRIER